MNYSKLVPHDNIGTTDASSPYLNIVAMLIESYILDSAWSLATAISIASNGPSVYLFIANNSTVKVCDLVTSEISFTNLSRSGDRLLSRCLSRCNWARMDCTDGAATRESAMDLQYTEHYS